MRNQNTDIIQGGLVAMVVLGNAISGVAAPGEVCNFLTVCCLPMMAAVAGFRFNLAKMERNGRLNFRRGGWPIMWNRLVRHWLIALAVYTLLTMAIGQQPLGIESRFSFANFIVHIGYPFSHLWYVLTLCGCMIIYAMCAKFHMNGLHMYASTTLYGLLLGCADSVILDHPVPPGLFRLPIFLNPWLLVYFGMGVAYRDRSFNLFDIRQWPRRYAVGFGVVVLVALAFAHGAIVSHGLQNWQFVLLWPLLTLFFFGSVSRFLSDTQDIYDEGLFVTKSRQIVGFAEIREKLVMLICETLAFLGRKDIIIYLWHALPIFVVQVAGFAPDFYLVLVLSLYCGAFLMASVLRNSTKEL